MIRPRDASAAASAARPGASMPSSFVTRIRFLPARAVMAGESSKRKRPSRIPQMAVLLLFLASGFASLVLETVFRRDLALLTGNAVTATSLTLSAFLLGLALGAAVFGRRADRTSRPLRLYGILELGAAGSS